RIRGGVTRMAIRKVGVVGCGLMGSGIAQVSAQAGVPTVVREVSKELLDKGMGSIRKFLQGGGDKGKMTAADMENTLGHLPATTELEDMADCDLVIEAITENIQVKHETFQALEQTCKPETLLASNTSSLSITEIASFTKRPDKVLGLHFFNPVPLMKLVEVVRTLATSDASVQASADWCRKVGKTVVIAPDRARCRPHPPASPPTARARRLSTRGRPGPATTQTRQ